MWVLLVLLGVPIIGGVTFLLLRRMPVKGTSLAVKLDVAVAWVAALSILLLVPLDIADTFSAANEGEGSNGTAPLNATSSSASAVFADPILPHASVWDPVREATATQRVLSVCWEVVYWYCFVAMMTILPFHQEFADSGAFTRWERTKWSLRQNALFLLFAGSCGAFGILVLLASHRLTVDSLLGFAIAASNAFGLCLVLLLLGYGLVDLPRKIWRLAAAGTDEKEHHFHVMIGQQAGRAKTAHRECCHKIAVVREVGKYFGPRDPLREYMDKVEAAICPSLESDLFTNAEMVPNTQTFAGAGCGYNFNLEEEDLEFEYADVHSLGLLRRDVRKAQEGYGREQYRYLELVKQAFASVYKVHVAKGDRHSDYDLAGGGDESYLLQGEPAGPSGAASVARGRAAAAWRRARSQYAKHLHPTVLRAFALILYFLSACIVFAQLTIYEGLPLWLKAISPLKLFIGLMEPNLMLIQVTCLALLGYILASCWFSMFKLKVFSIYVMIPGHTPSNSMLMNAMLLCRLAPPIAFNFMMISMPMTQDKAIDVRQTTFYNEFGEKMLDLSSLGSFLGLASLSFTTFAPLIMLPYMIFLLVRKTAGCSSAWCRRGRLDRLERRLDRFRFEEEEDDWDVGGDGTNHGSVGRKLLEREICHFENGLRLGKALRESLAEEAREGGKPSGILGRLLVKRSPSASEPTRRVERTPTRREEPPNGAAGTSAATRIGDRIRSLWGKGKPRSSAAAYEPVVLDEVDQWRRTYGSRARRGAAGGGESESSGSTESGQARAGNATEELDNIFRNL